MAAKLINKNKSLLNSKSPNKNASKLRDSSVPLLDISIFLSRISYIEDEVKSLRLKIEQLQQSKQENSTNTLAQLLSAISNTLDHNLNDNQLSSISVFIDSLAREIERRKFVCNEVIISNIPDRPSLKTINQMVAKVLSPMNIPPIEILRLRKGSISHTYPIRLSFENKRSNDVYQ